MRLIGFLLAASVALAVLKVAFQIVAVLAVGAAIWFGITRPVQTFGCLFMFVALGLVAQFPVAGMFIFGALAVVGLLAKQGNDKPRNPGRRNAS